MTNVELKPCPFCGGEALLVNNRMARKLWRVSCKNCDASPLGGYSMEEAISAWNRRASPPAAVPAIEATEAQADVLGVPKAVIEKVLAYFSTPPIWNVTPGEVKEAIAEGPGGIISVEPPSPPAAVPDAVAYLVESKNDPTIRWVQFTPEVPDGVSATVSNLYRYAPPAAVPDGWVMAPKEPTPEMHEAAARMDIPRLWEHERAALYRTMISAAPAAPNGWQPIGTAPKDGTDVLLWDGEEILVGYWSDSIWVSPGAWVKEEHRSDTVTYIPTHWMPLPAAPTEASDE